MCVQISLRKGGRASGNIPRDDGIPPKIKKEGRRQKRVEGGGGIGWKREGMKRMKRRGEERKV